MALGAGFEGELAEPESVLATNVVCPLLLDREQSLTFRLFGLWDQSEEPTLMLLFFPALPFGTDNNRHPAFRLQSPHW